MLLILLIMSVTLYLLCQRRHQATVELENVVSTSTVTLTNPLTRYRLNAEVLKYYNDVNLVEV